MNEQKTTNAEVLGVNRTTQDEQCLYIDADITDILPTMVKAALSKMSAEKQSMFVEEYKRKKKSLGLAYFFLIICLGIPYGYLGKWGLQLVYWLTGAGVFFWFFYLLFALPGMVRDYNKDVACQIVRDLKIMG